MVSSITHRLDAYEGTSCELVLVPALALSPEPIAMTAPIAGVANNIDLQNSTNNGDYQAPATPKIPDPPSNSKPQI